MVVDVSDYERAIRDEIALAAVRLATEAMLPGERTFEISNRIHDLVDALNGWREMLAEKETS